MSRTTKLKYLKRESITIGERFRQDYGDMEDFIESIKQKGILQPVTVDAEFNLLAGGRRMAAANVLALEEIPALVRETEDELDAREIELIENVYRKDFTWQEKAALVGEIDRLMKEKDLNWSGRKTAAMLNKSQTDVVRSLKLAAAMEAIPELKDCKTADDAGKMLRKMEEQTLVQELRNRQKQQVQVHGVHDALRIAEANYRTPADTFVELAALRDNMMIDLIECDPPYAIDLAEVKKSGDAESYEEISKENYPTFLAKLCKQLYRVADRNSWCVFWFGQSWFTEVKAALTAAGWAVDDIPGIWVKNQGQTMNPTVNLGRAWEPFFICRKGNPALNKAGRLNTFIYSNVHGSQKYHPTQRPLDLIEDVIETFVPVNSTVLVPFLGSGTTLRACYNLGCKCWGWDLNPEYKDRFMIEVESDSKRLFAEGDEE